MTEASPIAVLIAAASRDDVTVERLVRGASLVARALGHAEMEAWCRKELDGYPETDESSVPEYRKVGAELKARSPYGNVVPAIARGIGLQYVEFARARLSNDVCRQTRYLGEELGLVERLAKNRQNPVGVRVILQPPPAG